MPDQYVFVTGCPRSGTTALVQLLASHYAIVIGMERYKYVVREMRRRHDPTLLTPAHFEPERFLDFRDSDTNIGPGDFAAHYEAVRKRYAMDFARYGGDKVMPPDEWVLTALADRFPTARFLFIYRDLLAVADSFERRAANPLDTYWPPTNDHRAAPQMWLDGFSAAERLLDQVGPSRLLPIRYERLFEGSPAVCEAIFDYLGLPLWDGTWQTYRNLCSDWPRRRSAPLSLTPDQQAVVRAEEKPELVDQWDERFREAVAASG